MKVIYKPKGRALEYSPLACNLYIGCTHGCKYCYAPACIHKTTEDWRNGVYARDGILDSFESDCKYLAQHGLNDEAHRILFCFLSDPYQPLESKLKITHKSLEIAKRWAIKISVLTKGTYQRVKPDLQLMKESDVKLGVTLSFANDALRKQWEPNAASVESRLRLLREAHEMGIYTWVSMEPVIVPSEALGVIEMAHEFVDFWKVGKLNHNREIEGSVDWPGFRSDVTTLLEKNGCQYYIKEDLRKAK